MCRSVPQIEAVFTRTSTSVGPIKGTATVSICKPFAACIFRSAFIVPAIYPDSRSCNGRSFAFFGFPALTGEPVRFPRFTLQAAAQLASANPDASTSVPRQTFPHRSSGRFPSTPRIQLPAFCYSFLVVPSNGEAYVYPAQSHDPAHPPQPLRPHFRRGISFPSRRFFPVLAGMGLYGHVIPSHADYFRLFPEARSPTGGGPLAHTGKEQRAENHHSMGPVGCLWVVADSWIGLPFRLVSRPALADDSLPSLRLRRLSDHPLGHEGKQFRLSHRPSRRRAESHRHGTLSAGPPSHVLRRRSHAALHSSCAWLLVGTSGLPLRHPFNRPPPPPRGKNALPRPPRLFRLLPSHPLPPPPPPLVTSLAGPLRRELL